MTAIRKEVPATQIEITDILCNKCGKSCKTECGFECVTGRESWGYCSKKDMYEAEWHLCEDCVDALTATFKIPP